MIYVDPLLRTESRDPTAFRVGARNGHRWCHLFCDGAVEELHTFAQQLGMQRSWFQNDQDLPHYDLTPGKRASAVRAGAREVSFQEAVAIWKAQRTPPLPPPPLRCQTPVLHLAAPTPRTPEPMRLPIFTPTDPRVVPGFSNGPSTRGSHRLSTFTTCMRMWFFREMLGLIARQGHGYFTEGSALHLLLAYYYGVKLHDIRPQSWLTIPCEQRFKEITRGDLKMERLVLSAFQAYAGQVDDTGWTVLDVEHEHWATIAEVRRAVLGPDSQPLASDAQQLSARIDLEVLENGKVWFIDHKFLADRYGFKPVDLVYSDYARSWQFFVQQSIGLARHGSDFGGVIVQRIGKSAAHPVARDKIPFLPALHETLAATIGDLLQREQATAEAIWAAAQAPGDEGAHPMDDWLPPASPWACRGCDYWVLCAAPDAETRRANARQYFKQEE